VSIFAHGERHRHMGRFELYGLSDGEMRWIDKGRRHRKRWKDGQTLSHRAYQYDSDWNVTAGRAYDPGKATVIREWGNVREYTEEGQESNTNEIPKYRISFPLDMKAMQDAFRSNELIIDGVQHSLSPVDGKGFERFFPEKDVRNLYNKTDSKEDYFYIGNYTNGQKSGTGKLITPYGTMETGHWQGGFFEGDTVYTDAQGSTTKRQRKN